MSETPADHATLTAPRPSPRRALRVIAAWELFKGVVVLIAATGLFSSISTLREDAAALVEHMHLDPASHYPSIFLDAVNRLQDSHLVLLALGAAAYVAIRFAEAYGLYRDRAWAEWLCAVSAAVYLPFEVVGFVHDWSLLALALIVVNAAIVAVMVMALRRKKAAKVWAQHETAVNS